MEITEISLAEVTQQFLQYLQNLQTLDPNILADFLTVASKLLVIKSKSLLPMLEEELEEDDSYDLTYQLIQLKKFKEIAAHLRQVEAKKLQSYPRESTSEEIVTFHPDPTVKISVLHSALQSLAKTLEEITSLPKEVVKEVISISKKIQDLQNTITEKIETKLSSLLQKKSRTEVVVTFLALLELVKQRILSVEQENLFSDINIKRLPQDSSPPNNNA